MNTLTKEWLQNTITGIESIIDDKSFVCSEIEFEIGQVNNILTAFKIALASLAAVSDERAAYELFMEKRFGESVDRRRAKNGDREYMAWDMALGWIIWCHRAAMLQGGQPVNQTYNLPELIEGMEVSIDVSTCDADLGNRYFGTVTEALELDTAKNGYILLVQDAEPNFDVNGNSPGTPDSWISCSDQMPEKGQNVLISVNFDSSLVEPLICSARYTGSTFRRGDATIKPGNGIEQATHWMPLPEPPQEVNRG
ncbi:putative phage protein [Escherichia coli]|nr:putative phage protein [Escherichia coli]